MSDFHTDRVVHFHATIRSDFVEKTVTVPRKGFLGKFFGGTVTQVERLPVEILIFDEPICGDKELYFKPGALKARYGVEPGDRIQGLACIDERSKQYDIGNVGIARLSVGQAPNTGP